MEVIPDGYRLKCKQIQWEQCTVQNYYTIHLPKYEHCPVEEISETTWHLLGKTKKRPCKKAGCLRPAVTFPCSFLSFSPNRPVLDLTVPLESSSSEKMGERGMVSMNGPLTSVPLHLLQRKPLCQKEGWAEPRPGATTTAPGSFGFDDTASTKQRKRIQVSTAHDRVQHPATVRKNSITKDGAGISHYFGHSLCALGFMLTTTCWLTQSRLKRVNWDGGKSKPDTGTALIFSQQSASVPNNNY